MLSGSCGAQPAASAQQAGSDVAKSLGCDSAADVLTCLRAKTAAEIVAVPTNDGASTAGRAAPTIDGWFLRDRPDVLVGSPGFDAVPVIVSTTHDEFANQLGLYGGTHAVTTETEYWQLVDQLYPAKSSALRALYPVSNYASPNDALVALLGDAYFICPSRTVARQLARGTAGTWRAEFDHAYASGPLKGLAPHGIDLWFGFRNLTARANAPTPDENALADWLASAWVRFAQTGDPNGAGAIWPAYQKALDNYVAIDVNAQTAHGIRTQFCDFWSP
jgi:para-nitrobenzyl esterase